MKGKNKIKPLIIYIGEGGGVWVSNTEREVLINAPLHGLS